MPPKWTSYNSTQISLLAEKAEEEGFQNERSCPVCARRKVRTYGYLSSRTTGPTLISYSWCSNCHRFWGGTGPRPVGLRLDDPLDESEHERYDHDLDALLDHLDQLWDEGVLPQVPRSGGSRSHG